MKKEYWKPVVGYEGLYEVSNWGRVKSLKRLVKTHNKWGECYITINEKILKKRIDKYGYERVMLYKHGKSKLKQVHRLVAEAFIDNPDNLPCVNHKDENKLNNNVDNLEFCSVLYNNTYNERHKKIAGKNINGKKSKPVLQYNLDGTFVREWPSTMECERNGYNNTGISQCCLGKLKTYKGFIWKYKNEEDN